MGDLLFFAQQVHAAQQQAEATKAPGACMRKAKGWNEAP